MQGGPNNVDVARERWDYISGMTAHYGRAPASVSLLASFMRDAMTAWDTAIYIKRAGVKTPAGWEFTVDDMEGHATGRLLDATLQLLDFQEGRLALRLRQALQERNPEGVMNKLGGPEGIVASLESKEGEQPMAFFNAATECGLTMMEEPSG